MAARPHALMRKNKLVLLVHMAKQSSGLPRCQTHSSWLQCNIV